MSRVGAEAADELVVALVSRERHSVSEILESWFRERARAAVAREIDRHAAALGVRPTGVTIRDQRTRWGSASRQGRLAFSWRLVLAPPEILESVVIHELAHLRVFGHGPKFWALVESRCPEYRVRRTWLRRHRIELHAVLRAVPQAAPRTDGSPANALR